MGCGYQKGECMKAQYFSVDAVFGTAVFLIALSVLLVFWFNLKDTILPHKVFVKDSALYTAQHILSMYDNNGFISTQLLDDKQALENTYNVKIIIEPLNCVNNIIPVSEQQVNEEDEAYVSVVKRVVIFEKQGQRCPALIKFVFKGESV